MSITLVLILFCSSAMFAQKGELKGVVKDSKTNELLPGARVELMEKTQTGTEYQKRGVVSNNKGEFSFKFINQGEYSLTISFIGYKKFTRDVTVTDKTITIDGVLIPDVVGLEEVVVTGVASRREKGISDVSVARIDAEDLQSKNTYQDISGALTGKIPGVQVTTSSGNVGGGIRFDVRGGGGLNGDGQPVIFVDGTRIINDEVGFDIGGQFFSTLANLNPEDIESVEILKGPAGGALYGTSASNGVVLITTKRGKGSTDYMDVNYKTTYGWHEQSFIYDTNQFLSADAANAIFRKGIITQNIISVTGRSGMFNYYGAYTNRAEDGIVPNNSFKRETFRANFDVMATRELKFGVSTAYTWSDNVRPINDNNIFGWMGNTMLFPNPYLFTDSLAILGINNQMISNNFVGNVSLSYMPEWLPGLSFSGMMGLDNLNYRNDYYFPTQFDYISVGSAGDKDAMQRTRSMTSYQFDINYDYNITKDLQASTMIGAQMFENYSTFMRTNFQGFASDKITNFGAAETHIFSDDGLYDFREAGIFLNQYFTYQERYFLTLAFRNDYSSVIGEEAPSIFYPRVSGAVRLDKFNILPSSINFMKVRAAYGQSGALPSLLAAYPLRWAGGQSGFGVGGLISSIGNDQIVPERLQEIEFGLEMEFLNQYGFDFTYSYLIANESIISVPNSPSSGLTATAVPTNLGGLNNWGFEAQLWAIPILTRDYELKFNVNIAQQQNEIQDLGGENKILRSGDYGWYVGYPKYAYWGQKILGARFDEQTGEYLAPILSDSAMFHGTPVPTFFGSFFTEFRFLKHFTLGVMFEWKSGHHVYNFTRAYQARFGNDVEFNELEEKIYGPDGLTPGTQEYIDAAERYAYINPDYLTGYVEVANLVRLREISLKVDLTEWMTDLFGRRYVKNLYLFASVYNLALWTKYTGADPEVDGGGSRTDLVRSRDFLTLQNPRTFNFTLNIGL